MKTKPLSTTSWFTLICLLAAGAFLPAFAPRAAAAPPTYDLTHAGEFMKTWLLCGPFPLQEENRHYTDDLHLQGFDKDWLADSGGETALIQPSEGATVPGPDGPIPWRLNTTSEDFTDLDQAVTTDPAVFTYAYCEIDSPIEQAYVLSLGSNDGSRAWLNGLQIYDRTRGGVMLPDDALIPILLRPGRNALLLKLEERGGTWQFCCRLLPFGHPELETARLPLFRIETSAQGAPTLRCLLSPDRADALIEGAAMTAIYRLDPQRTAWQAAWTGAPTTPIEVDPAFYNEYDLILETTFAGGAKQDFRLPFTAGDRIEHPLFQGGRSDYAIVLSDEPSESERWAADELHHCLKEISGADFPILSTSHCPDDKNMIIVGANDRSRALVGDLFPEPDANGQSFTYLNRGPHIILWGGSRCGAMYAALTFLETELGCRWYTPAVTVTPERKTYSFHLLWHSEAPGIAVRNVFYYEAFDPLWAAHNKVNGSMGLREQPGGVESYWSVHTFNRLLPPDEFFDEHPEYYSLIDGKRTAHEAQLCLTNPEVLRIVTQRLLEFMRKEPGHYIYSLSQNDGEGPCQCARCQALAQREGSESGPILSFVNQVAEQVEKEFPDKLIGTLAYVYSRKPPKTLRPRSNVVIRLCTFECCRAHPLTECPMNASFVDDINGWVRIAPRLYIWDYVVEFGNYILPFPNFKVLQPNIQFFRDHNAIGVMSQAAYTSRGAEFAELRAYLLAKLLWNPDCDAETVINDFMHGYYGRSGQFVRAYYDLLQGLVTPATHLRLFKPTVPMFTQAFIDQADALFDQAEVVADNDAIRQRVEMARLPILYLKCHRDPAKARQDGTYARFCQIVDREGIIHFAEAGAPHVAAFHEMMKAPE